MERAASALPSSSYRGVTPELPVPTRLRPASQSTSGSPSNSLGSSQASLLLQVLQQQGGPSSRLGGEQQAHPPGAATGASPDALDEEGLHEQDQLATSLELFSRLSHSEASTPMAKMSRTLSCGDGPAAAQAGLPPPISPAPAASLPLGKFKPSLSSGGSPMHMPSSRASTTSRSQQPEGEPSSEQFDLPTSITLAPTTDAMQAAGLINLSLSQPGASSFLLHIPQQPAQGKGGKPGRSLLSVALSVVLATRKINAATQQGSEVAMLPVFRGNNPPSTATSNKAAQASQECMDVHVYRLSVPPPLLMLQAQLMRVQPASSPLVLALQLAQAVQAGAVVDITFGAQTASTALQAMALARANITSCGQDVVLLPQQLDSSGRSYLAKAIPTALLLQGREPTTSASTSAPLAHQPFPSALDFAALGMGGMRASPPPTSTDPSSLITSAALMDRLANSYSSPYAPPQTSSGPAASSGASASTPNGNGGHSGMGASASPFGGGGYGAWGGAGQSMMGADAPSSSFPSPALSLLNSSGPMGGGMQGMGANPFALAAASSGVGGMGGGGRPRARKADWVIVTEDTAIKNAAGAVAKVLGRVSDQGLSCPVFTEKKAHGSAAVVSVAVKAITVARGYVSNEGTGHELGFQPYLRSDSPPTHASNAGSSGKGSMGSLGAHGDKGSGSSRQQSGKGGGGMGGSGSEQAASSGTIAASSSMGAGSREELSSSELPSEQQQQQQQQQGGGGQASGNGGGGSKSVPGSPSARGGGGGGDGVMEGQQGEGVGAGGGAGGEGAQGGGARGGGENEVGEGEGGHQGSEAGEAERAEMAFDVYKLPQMPEVPEIGNLPVKVTAHSRPNVVCNIITKLVSERDGAVLITAGGKAMHVAMTAVVSARARLRARCSDVLLLPKFVTVDTTSTLGWESVFLRFTIMRWPVMPTGGAAGFMGPAAMGMGAAALGAMGGGMGMAGLMGGGMGAGGMGMMGMPGMLAGAGGMNSGMNLGGGMGGMSGMGMGMGMPAGMGSVNMGGMGGMNAMGLGALTTPASLAGFEQPFDQVPQPFMMPQPQALEYSGFGGAGGGGGMGSSRGLYSRGA